MSYSLSFMYTLTMQPPPVEKADYLSSLDALWFKLLPFIIAMSAVAWAWDKYKDRRYVKNRDKQARR